MFDLSTTAITMIVATTQRPVRPRLMIANSSLTDATRGADCDQSGAAVYFRKKAFFLCVRIAMSPAR